MSASRAQAESLQHARTAAAPSPLRAARSAAREWRHTAIGRRVVQAWRLASAPREIALRRAAARAALRGWDGALKIDPRRGYVFFGPEELPGVGALLEHCERVLERARPHLDASRELRAERLRLVAELVSDELLAREPAFVDFALQDSLLLPAIDYLRTVPFLARVSLAISFHVPELAQPDYFQRFHVDNDDFRHLKLYLNVRPIAAEDGPLSFLPAEASARVLAALRREGRGVGRATTFSDEEVYRHCDPAEIVRVTGPRGAGAIVDLSRCLHFGSRVAPGHERVVFGAGWLRYQRLHENPSNQLDAALARGDALRALALRGPRRYERGHFYPDLLELASQAS